MDEHLQNVLKKCGSELENTPANKDTLIKVLKEAAECLSEIDQSLSEAVFKSMQPVMNAIVNQELLKHYDKEVKLLVAACACEISRVTCPRAAYDDYGILKDIFQLIVSTFSGLRDMKDPSFGRRVTILEVVAKCRLCLLMLDLECYDSINEMFRIFFAVVSDEHSESVITSMKTIMVLLLERNMKINEDLLLIIFSVLGGDKKLVTMAASKLAKDVIKQCAGKLETGIKQFIKKFMWSTSPKSQIDYHEVIHDIPQVLKTTDVQSLSNVGRSKEVNDRPVCESGCIEINNLANGEKRTIKSVASRRSTFTSAKKKEKLSAGDKRQEDIPKGDTNNPQNLAEVQTSQVGVPLSPVTAGNQDEVADGVIILAKKMGRPLKTQPKTPETPLAVIAANNHNGDAIPLVNVDKVPNTSSGIELTLQHERSKTVEGKRRKIFKFHRNNTLTKTVKNSFIPMSDDQPHSSVGKKPSGNSECPVFMANDDGQKLSFEKRSQHWETLESMEVFRLFPQTPHFHPLDSLRESARERQAIHYMVDFSCVFEDTFRLRIDHPRTEMEDKLETLSELESHGFDIGPIRNCLVELLSVKDEQERLDTLLKEAWDKLKYQEESVESERYDKELELIDEQVNELLIKRDQCLKKKEKSDSEVALLKAEIEGINEGMLEARRKFDHLAYARVYDR